MLTAQKFFVNGQVKEAVATLVDYLRDHPADTTQRTFLFELLCFSGQFDRAEKHLTMMAGITPEASLGVLFYQAAIAAEKKRHDMLQTRSLVPPETSSSFSGSLNGKPFTSITDADSAIGSRLEMFTGDAYLRIGFEHLASVTIEPPRKLRDTLWTPAQVTTGPSLQNRELGEVLLPAIYPFTWRDAEPLFWLGRGTGWTTDDESGEYPYGQKTFLVDGEEVPLLEVRSLHFAARKEPA